MGVDEREAIKDPSYDMKFYSAYDQSPPTSVSNYRLSYKFKLPNLNYDSSKPAVFRWVWMCGYDAQCDCTPANASRMHPNVTTGDQCPSNDYVGYGLGEIFINCTDIQKVNGNGSPLPSTQAPTTEAPATTEAATTQAPTTQEPHPCFV